MTPSNPEAARPAHARATRGRPSPSRPTSSSAPGPEPAEHVAPGRPGSRAGAARGGLSRRAEADARPRARGGSLPARSQVRPPGGGPRRATTSAVRQPSTSRSEQGRSCAPGCPGTVPIGGGEGEEDDLTRHARRLDAFPDPRGGRGGAARCLAPGDPERARDFLIPYRDRILHATGTGRSSRATPRWITRAGRRGGLRRPGRSCGRSPARTPGAGRPTTLRRSKSRRTSIDLVFPHMFALRQTAGRRRPEAVDRKTTAALRRA